ncbi:MAG TPA: GNAT family N-acetyltransferase [bacterium]|nr:GNAT family N-acetyltransferase [bacterium]
MGGVEITGFVPGTIGRVTELHGRYYSRHWGLDMRFEAEVARELGEFMGRYDPARDSIWAAVDGDTILGSITIDGSGTPGNDARLRWFILDEACQGRGVGQRLMAAAMDFCAAAGFEHVFLWTFRGLDAARALYDRWGFQVTDSFEDTDWGHPVLHQRLDKVLGGAEDSAR